MTETLELEPDAFWRMVTQEKLQVDGPSAGYMWTGKQGRDGWETFKVRAQPIGWLYQARRACVQNNGAGGALTVRIQVPTGVTAQLISARVVGSASAGATLTVGIADEDSAIALWLGYIAAGVSNTMNLPSIGGSSGSTGNIANSTGLILGPGEYFYATTSAALQTETLTIAVVLLMSANSAPTWDTTGSAGTPALGASSISAANTLQAVYL